MSKRVLFTPEHEAVIKENFTLLDDDKDGKLTYEQAALLYRALGQTVSEKDISLIFCEFFKLKDPPPLTEPLIDFEKFTDMFQLHYSRPLTEDALSEAFRVFDANNSGRLSADKLRELLSTRGERLSPQDMERLLMLANQGRDQLFDYVALAKRLIDGPEGIHNM
eukprot:GHVU01167866.1.p1 GENE.GHVU01167866.1~~GHVU01167866.1.p1  ORF type:complete len:165 (-),score=37.79 GHVU01167866.1:317-811(-)